MIVGFTGYAQSGKDTAAGFLVERGFKRLAFADILRESLYALNPIVSVYEGEFDTVTDRVQDIVDDLGWDHAKVDYPEIRQLLQRFGTEVGRELYGENFWVERVTRQIEISVNIATSVRSVKGDYVITDVRFPNEEKAVHALGGKIYRIARTGVKAANTHASEDIEGLLIDGVIPNHDSLDQFRANVLEVVGLN